jgi:putative ABC transport system substrate-binding protein
MLKQAAAEHGGIVFHEYVFPYRGVPEGLVPMLSDASAGLTALEDQVDFWWEVSGPLGEVDDLMNLTLAKSRKPVLYGNRMRSVQAGALFGMVQDSRLCGREVAALARDILEGTDPGTIPVQPPADFVLGLNLTTALNLGIVVPSGMMAIAGKNVVR